MLNYPVLRRATICVAAASVLLSAQLAGAKLTVTIKPGDNIYTLARKYDVSVPDIAKANGIHRDALLRDGRKVVIPDPPKTVSRPASMRAAGKIKGDRIAIRRGPDVGYRRVTLLDEGAAITITYRSGDWAQVSVPNGESGWVRGDFVTTDGKKALAAVAKPKVSPEAKRRVAQAAKQDEQRAKKRRSVRTARNRHSTRSASLTRRRSRPEVSAPSTSNDVIRTAYAYRGTPYRYGGTSRNGFDCSGFTSYVYKRKGVSLPHSSSAQFSKGKKVSSDNLKAGDLVFFKTGGRSISHVGIYAGEGKFVHAPKPGSSVRVDSLNSGYYKNRYRGARRVK